MQENAFWGAGKLGRMMCELWDSYGIRPDYIFDNNRQLEGTCCNGIMISPKEKIKELVNPRFFITCSRVQEIALQIQKEYGFTDIVECGSIRKMLKFILQSGGLDYKRYSETENKKYDVFWDLNNGMVLGGVESWVFESAERLQKMGYICKYLSTDARPDTMPDVRIESRTIPYAKSGWLEGLKMCQDEILTNLPCTVICNFTGYNFLAACMAKSAAGENVRLIAVLHSDDDAYYEAYTDMESLIDICLVVSKRIERKLVSKGFPEKKCCYLPWIVSCEQENARTYSEAGSPVRLGYAGRIVKSQKRADCLVKIAKRLRDKGVPFYMEIAGEGDVQRALEEEIIQDRLQEAVNFVGVIRRMEISAFWKRQDIMLSCSEVEGHSISQAEAMASGAVPVITNVSGAEDDVLEGQNGFLVEVGDIDGIVEKICYLHRNRNKLVQMGRYAHASIYMRQTSLNQNAFWEDLLKRGDSARM